eukprot:CAMPEP_0113651902 /NCGR_PEP_ID=MMETSP0017_2-20120614/27686_1 /TAXON_ID=2856 /ORGANISM="Cylindrotheca closterium" /LENGTH=1286 /DNA_ID=CAMNT_0000564645 /DNA_START=247 /DNA_END=4110 /DNA_ORIENTATION=- /assembly_acc=CAM_ASM_000147
MAENSDGGSAPNESGPGNRNQGGPSNLLAASQDTFTKQETKAVNSVKTVVYLILFLSAVGFAVGTFFLVDQEQSQAYKADFYSLTDMVAMDVQLKLRNMVTQLQTTSSSITSLMTPPNKGNMVTLPQFDRRMQDYGINSTNIILYAPLIAQNDKAAWESYATANQDWIDLSLEQRGWTATTTKIPETIQSLNTTSIFQDKFAPIWQMSPVPTDRSIINSDLFSLSAVANLLTRLDSATTKKAEMSGVEDVTALLAYSNGFDALTAAAADQNPTSLLGVPVYQDFVSSTIVGYLVAIVQWNTMLTYPLEDSEGPIQVDISQSSCGSGPQGFSYIVNTNGPTYLGTTATAGASSSSSLENEYPLFSSCDYTVKVSSSEAFKESYQDSAPVVSAVLVFILFLFIMSVFFMYDCIVQRRQKKLLVTAQRTNAVVSSLFPEDVQRRIMQEAEANEKKEQRMTVTNKMKEFLQDTNETQPKSNKATELRGKPIADFFPEATVMFADLVGFTAWSSMREPTQVFTLLETVYNAFDEIARRRRVFKVETVGDCYVAVSGLPDPCVDHALVMARFASDCRIRMNDLVKELEVSLGPDTTELAMRFGLHSGPVTAGVLRGDKARFQLFGDTMNTTSRIESTGKRDRIHISQETADYLIKAGKNHWLKLREDKVTAKGKGELTTYWLAINKLRAGAKTMSGSTSSEWSLNDESKHDDAADLASNTSDDQDKLTEKHRRLVNWITNEMAEILRQLEVSRIGREDHKSLVDLEQLSVMREAGKNPLDEVIEIITLPRYSAQSRATSDELERENYMLPKFVIDELRSYVSTLAGMYLENPFHNFEHASHVTMSVVKLLSRIVAPNIQIEEDDIEAALHDKTYGITSDPLTQFAVVLSALVHDVDHPGVPNSQLTKEGTRLAELYRDKSVAEQNSVDLAWTLLMEGNFKNLRKTIYHTEDEFQRFRALLVNTVLATDIMDKELGSLRKDRWNKAFNEEVVEDQMTAVNRKATIVIEHIIQASDIAHTMQHWHIYRKWNSRLFEEMYKAYTEGRAEKNPAQTWYEGEIGFFDFYIIPLAKKLKDCGVFGVSSDEYLNYAMQNRREWELHGEKVVAGMIESIRMKTSQNYRKPAIAADGHHHANSVNIDKLNLRQIPTEISTVPMTELPMALNVLFADGSDTTCFQFARSVAQIAPKWTVKFANSGAKAVQIATSPDTQFDLIFIDQYFVNDESEVLGTDAVVEMRNKGIRGRICGMSANDHENIFDDAGADSFMFKPLPQNADALKQDLLRILNGGDEDDMI